MLRDVRGALLFGGVAEDLAEDACPGGGFAAGDAEMLSEASDDRLAGVGGKAAGVAGNVHDVEQELGEAFAVSRCGGGLVEEGNFFGLLEAFAGELVEADGYGLAQVHGEVAGGFRREEGDG